MTQDTADIDIEGLLTYFGEDRVVHCKEIREDVKDRKPRKKIHIGIGALDTIVDGIEAGELISIGGPTKNGKTLLAQTLTRNIAEGGGKVLWFTFEVPVHQFLTQIPEVIGFYMPKTLVTKNLEWVFKRIAESKLKYGTDAVFIDNLHHLFDLAAMRNPNLDIGVVIRMLKRIAITLDVTIFILCHSRKPAESRGQLPEVS